MTQPSENKSFGLEDIERYHAGTLPPEERHALEKAALEDSFLADALEGYALTPTPSADLAALHGRLAARLEERKVRTLFPARSWLSAAAVVFVLIGASFFTYRLLQTSPAKLAEERSSSVPATDSASSSSLSAVADSSSTATNMVADESEPASRMPAEKPSPAIGAATAMSRASKDKQAKPEYPYSANPPALAPAGKQSSMAKADRNEYTIAKAPAADTAAAQRNSDAYKEGYLSKAKADTALNMGSITMKRLNDQPANVVVFDHRAPRPVSDRTREHVKLDSLEPAGGWVKFDDYIASNIKTPNEIKSKPENPGAVVLSFDVNKQGEPVNITVVQSLCSACDEEAIRLLKAGPRWTKKKSRGKVTIHF